MLSLNSEITKIHTNNLHGLILFIEAFFMGKLFPKEYIYEMQDWNNIFIVGTVNQVAHPDISFKTMIKLAQIVIKN